MAENSFGDFYDIMMEAAPQTAFMGALSRTPYSSFNTTAPQKQRYQDYWQNQYSNIYNQYLGNRATQMKRGTDPSQWTSFTDYLEDEAPFTNRYSSLSPTQRGMSTRRFNPSTRFITY